MTVNEATSPIVIGRLTDGTASTVTVHATTRSATAPSRTAFVNGTPGITRLPRSRTWWRHRGPDGGPVVVAPTMQRLPTTGYTVTTFRFVNLRRNGYEQRRPPVSPPGRCTPARSRRPTRGPRDMAATVDATPLSAQVLLQNVTVTRPTGALVLAQVCGSTAWSRGDRGINQDSRSAACRQVPAVDARHGTDHDRRWNHVDPRYGEGRYPYAEKTTARRTRRTPRTAAFDLGNETFVAKEPGAIDSSPPRGSVTT